MDELGVAATQLTGRTLAPNNGAHAIDFVDQVASLDCNTSQLLPLQRQQQQQQQLLLLSLQTNLSR